MVALATPCVRAFGRARIFASSMPFLRKWGGLEGCAERGGRGTAGFELQTWLSSSFVAHTQAKHFPSRHIGKWGVPFVLLQRFVRWHSRASTPRVDLMWRALAGYLLKHFHA